MILKFLAHTPRGEGINGNELRHIVFYANQPRPFLFMKTTLIFQKRISNCLEIFVTDYFNEHNILKEHEKTCQSTKFLYSLLVGKVVVKCNFSWHTYTNHMYMIFHFQSAIQYRWKNNQKMVKSSLFNNPFKKLQTKYLPCQAPLLFMSKSFIYSPRPP